MAFDGLREYLQQIAEIREVQHVKGAHWDLELACINELVSENRGPALLFDEIPGYPRGFRVACNVFNTSRRTSLAIDQPVDMAPLQTLDVWRKRVRDVTPLAPVEAANPTITQNVLTGDDVDVNIFPAPKWHERDGGRYLGTGGIIILRDPDEGWVNCGVYRVMVQGKNVVSILTGATHGRTIVRKYHSRNESCPVAICMSPDPLMAIAGGMSIPWRMSEYDFVGGLRGKPVQTTKGPKTGLPVPAHGEILLEGEIRPNDETFDEGPFGEWDGYIAGRFLKEGKYTLTVRVNAISHANDPILLGVRPLKPPTPWFSSMPLVTGAQMWNQLEDAGFYGIKGVWSHVLESYGAVWTIIAVDQQYNGYAKQVGYAASVLPATGGYGVVFMTVDDNIDICDLQEVLWAVATRCRLQDGVQLVNGVRMAPLFPYFSPEERAKGHTLGSRIIFDACIPWHLRSEAPPPNVFPQKYREEVAAKWDIHVAKKHRS